MTPKEKAIQLKEKFQGELEKSSRDDIRDSLQAKFCALICVEEIIREYNKCFVERITGEAYETYKDYWVEVKEQIKKL